MSKQIAAGFLKNVADTLEYKYGVSSVISHHHGAPALILEVGNIVYFRSSGDMRIFLDPPVSGRSHKTFQTPHKLCEFVSGLYEEA